MAMHILSQLIYTYSSGGVVVQLSAQVLGRTAAPDYQNIKIGTINGKDALVTGFSNSNGPCRVQFDLWNHQGGWQSIWSESFYGVSDVTLSSVRAFHRFGDNPRQIWTLSEANGTFRVLETVPQQTPQGSYALTVLLARTGNGMVLLENFVNISAQNKP